jgi:GT2 family glycosyltransferase
MEEVTVGIVNFNGKDTLPETVRAVMQLAYPAFRVMVVDNHSTDGSLAWVQQQFPQVDCICLGENLGPAGAKNRILQESQTEYVFILDNDIVVEPDVLTRLMHVIQKVPQAGICHPEICDPADPSVHHYNGGWIHYLCGFISRPKPGAAQLRPEYEVYDVLSGAAILIKRSVALQLGGFDEDYFFNWEDGDFSARFTLAGYLCLNVPAAIVHHRSKPRRTSKVFYQTRNRWFFVVKLYSWRTLLLAAPMFLVFEVCQMLFLLWKGAGRDYLKGNLAAVQALPVLLKKRQRFQRFKVKQDRDWLKTGTFFVPGQLVGGKGIQVLLNVFTNAFNFYWQLIRPYVRGLASPELGR